jgi:rRNA small subunit pseudouridine methyltransferase Nep1
MTRAYRVKGKKRKNKYHREQEEQVQPKKPNLQKEIIREENNNNELIGIPIAPPTENNSEKPGVIFILEKASLEIAKVGKVLLFSFCYMDLGHIWIQLIELIY